MGGNLVIEIETCKYQVFFVQDRVHKGEVTIKYCATQMMLADYFINQWKDGQNIQGRQNILQTHIFIEINPNFNR